MITHNRLNDFSSVYTNYLNKLESNDQAGGNTDGYKFYRFVSSPDAVVLFDFGRVTSSDIKKAGLTSWKALPGTNTPDAWKIQVGSNYSDIKRKDYSDIESARTGKHGTNIRSVVSGLSYKIITLINNNPANNDPYKTAPINTPKSTSSGINYVKNVQKELGINSENDFINAVVDQGWIDSFRSKPTPLGTTVDFSSYNKLFQSLSDKTINSNAVGVEWFGYFRPPDINSQYSFIFSTSNGGNFLMWLGNKAICEYTPTNADIMYPNVEFTPKNPIREPKYYPIRIQYYANSNSDLSRNFSFRIKNLTTKNDVELSKVLFKINDGNYLPKLQYLAFLSTSTESFANGALTCYANDINDPTRLNSFYEFINRQKYITLNKKNDKDKKTGDDQFGIIEEGSILHSIVSDPNNPLSSPVVFSIYRLDVDMRMNKTFQINTKMDSATNSYLMNSVDDSLTTLGSTYTTLPNFYPDNPTAAIDASAADCEKLCNEKPTCNWYFAYQSSGINKCIVDTRKSQPTFNQVRPTGGNKANSDIDEKTSSLNLRNYSFPKSKGCGPNSVLLDDSEIVLNTQIYTDSFPYSTYIIDPKVISTHKESGKCSDPAYLKLNAEAKNILSKNTLYQEDGQYQHSDGTMSLSNYPPYTDKKFWENIQETFSTKNTNALSDTRDNAAGNIAKEQQLENTNSQINSTYGNLSTNIQNYNKMKTFMENDVNYDLSGNTLLYFRNPRKPTLREQNALDSNTGGHTQNTLLILGSITAASLLILAVLLGRD